MTSTGIEALSSDNACAISKRGPLWLRIIQINDVYELDHLPRFKTLVDKGSVGSLSTSNDDNEEQQQLQQRPDKTIVICCGDFVAPSLLSSLDEGYSMIDILNQCHVNYVCLGNHEADISISALNERITKQSQFTWINTNIIPSQQDSNEHEKLGTPTNSKPVMTLPFDDMPKSVEIVVGGEQQQQEQTVVLLGLLTNDPSLYRSNAFGGNITILPTYDCIMEYCNSSTSSNPKTDTTSISVSSQQKRLPLIIPLTHQSIQNDRILAQQLAHVCPIMCGGHDHEVYHETIFDDKTASSTTNDIKKNCQIIKAGMDAQNAAIIDIRWNELENDDDDVVQPNITVQIIPTSQYEPDEIVQQQVMKHQAILIELEQAKLFRISDWITEQNSSFTTVNNRIGASTGTSAICTMIQMGARATCCIMNAGAIRGNTTYDIQSYFTWKHLKNEIPFTTEICTCTIPGHVIQDMILHSRHGSYHHNPPIASGGYLHTCRNIQLEETLKSTSDTSHRSVQIVSIGDETFDPDKEYLVALPKQFFDGIDNHKPLLEWAKQYPPSFSEETCIPAKIILVQVFAATMWLSLGQFNDIDINNDGLISRDEIRNRLILLNDGHKEHVADLIVDNVLSICDLNDDGYISPIEMMICQYVATDMLRHVGTRDEIRTITNIVMNVLGDSNTNATTITSYDDVATLVDHVRNTIDIYGDGSINRNEIATVFKGKIQRGSDLLH